MTLFVDTKFPLTMVHSSAKIIRMSTTRNSNYFAHVVLPPVHEPNQAYVAGPSVYKVLEDIYLPGTRMPFCPLVSACFKKAMINVSRSGEAKSKPWSISGNHYKQSQLQLSWPLLRPLAPKLKIASC